MSSFKLTNGKAARLSDRLVKVSFLKPNINPALGLVSRLHMCDFLLRNNCSWNVQLRDSGLQKG